MAPARQAVLFFRKMSGHDTRFVAIIIEGYLAAHFFLDIEPVFLQVDLVILYAHSLSFFHVAFHCAHFFVKQITRAFIQLSCENTGDLTQNINPCPGYI